MKRIIAGLSVVGLSTLPLLVQAQGQFTNIKQLVDSVGTIVTVLLPIVFALAVLAFFYGLVKYIWSSADDEKVAGKRIMIWGVVAIAVMSALYGLAGFLQDAFGIKSTETIKIPKIPQ